MIGIGIAAGYDKSATRLPFIYNAGYDHAEIGTFTLRPRAGNSGETLRKLPGNQGWLNRIGLRNDGVDAVLDRVRNNRPPAGFRLGANIAAENGDDLEQLITACQSQFSFITVNLSCPSAATAFPPPRHGTDQLPLFVKISPDLGEDRLRELVAKAIERGIDGVVATNTTRLHAYRFEGGLSGPRLLWQSTEVVKAVKRLSQGRLRIIGCGGVSTLKDILDKRKAGADAVQMRTALGT